MTPTNPPPVPVAVPMVPVPEVQHLSDLVYRTYRPGNADNPRDCPHGHKRGKCDTCDLIEAEARIAALEAELARVKAENSTLRAADDHSCHDACTRPLCVMRRERDTARNDLAALVARHQAVAKESV